MEEEKQSGFLGTYFDRDMVLRVSRLADIISWIVLVVYLLTWLVSVAQFIVQLATGMFFDKGQTWLNWFNMFSPYLQQPLPGLFYFVGLQAVSHGLLIFLDIEDNLRRAARK
ncbi:MAG: hypothetical protein M1282_02435 [Chloroflexi bacterium]|nr:hypothetical protein [Chloroflexota bacterium]